MVQKDYNTEIISREIQELISTVDKFFVKKDEFVDGLRQSILSASGNN